MIPVDHSVQHNVMGNIEIAWDRWLDLVLVEAGEGPGVPDLVLSYSVGSFLITEFV